MPDVIEKAVADVSRGVSGAVDEGGRVGSK
jgi:hypothetical protein